MGVLAMILDPRRWMMCTAWPVSVLMVLATLGAGAEAQGRPAGASLTTHGTAARKTSQACRPMTGAETLETASRWYCVVVPFAGRWSVDLRGRVLTQATGVSAAVLPKAVVWLAAGVSTVPQGRRPGFTLYVTPDRTGGGNLATGARALATLPTRVRTATIEDAGDGVALIDSRLRNGGQAIYAVSYEHPHDAWVFVRAPAGWSFGPMSVRRDTIAVWAYPGNPATTSRASLYVAHVTAGVSSPVRIYRGPAAGSGWFLDGLRLGGKAVPAAPPIPMPRIAGYQVLRVGGAGTAGQPVIEAPRGWTVKALPGGSSVGVDATDPRNRTIQVTVWRNGCIGCYDADPLGLIQGPDEPTAGLPTGTAVRWMGDHTVQYVSHLRLKGRAYVRVVRVTVPPDQGTDQVSVTVPAGDAALVHRILSTFRWS